MNVQIEVLLITKQEKYILNALCFLFNIIKNMIDSMDRFRAFVVEAISFY